MSCYFRPILYSVLFALVSGAAFASDPTSSLSQQRYDYEMAKASLRSKKLVDFQKYYQSLDSYPLKPYLDYAVATKKLYPLVKGDVEHFINAHQDSYLGDRLLRQYLHVLAQQGAWKDFLYWYQPKLTSKELKCRWLEARINTGDKTALSEVFPLWNSPKSLPKRCDTLFSQWMKSDDFTPDKIWQRFMSALTHSNRGLSRYLASKLPKEQHRYAQLASELDSRPYRIGKLSRFQERSQIMQDIIAFAVQKYAKKHPQDAYRTWEKYEASQLFSEATVTTTKSALVNALLRKGHTDQVREIVAQSPSVRSVSTVERMIRQLLSEQRWQDVLATIAFLPAANQNDDRWRYWSARAEESLQGQYTANVREAFIDLAKKRSFYGFLAADRLGTSYQLSHQPAEFSPQVLDALEQKPALARAKELWLTGHNSEAYAEWYYGLGKLSSRQLAAAGVLAHRWGWYDRAIDAMIAGKHWNHLGIRFPLAYREHVLEASTKTDVKPALIFAIARQESAMAESAKSSAGARGLMQLMPRTADQTARKQGVRHKTEDLYKADHNIALGSHYLDELLDKYQGNRILAAAAYNAGQRRVKQWMNNAEHSLPFDLWIETIPFRETRGYVQNVLTYTVIYSYRMGQPEPLITKSEAKSKL